MKVQTSKAPLLSRIGKVQIASTERHQGGLGLKAEAGTLKMAGTDQSIAVYCWHACEVIEEGTAVVPAKLFCDLVRELPDGPVLFTIKDNHMLVQAGEGYEFQMRLPLLADAEWNEAPKHDVGSNRAVLKATGLAYLLEQVYFCVGVDASRAYGNVGYLHRTKNGKLRVVGTDGYRLSFAEGVFDLPPGFLPSGISLSKKALAELLRLCQDGFEELELAISEDESTLSASVPGYELYIALSAVTYPKYEAILPLEEKQFSIGVTKPVLQTVSKRVMLAAGKSRALQLNLQSERLTLKAKSLGNIEGVEAIKLASYQGPPLSLSINGKYLSDIFTTMHSETCTINFIGKEDPIVLAPDLEPEGYRSLHVLVPIRESE